MNIRDFIQSDQIGYFIGVELKDEIIFKSKYKNIIVTVFDEIFLNENANHTYIKDYISKLALTLIPEITKYSWGFSPEIKYLFLSNQEYKIIYFIENYESTVQRIVNEKIYIDVCNLSAENSNMDEFKNYREVLKNISKYCKLYNINSKTLIGSTIVLK